MLANKLLKIDAKKAKQKHWKREHKTQRQFTEILYKGICINKYPEVNRGPKIYLKKMTKIFSECNRNYQATDARNTIKLKQDKHQENHTKVHHAKF